MCLAQNSNRNVQLIDNNQQQQTSTVKRQMKMKKDKAFFSISDSDAKQFGQIFENRFWIPHQSQTRNCKTR